MLERRHYTIEEARRTLPLVRRIVADIAETAKALQQDGDSDRLQGRLKRTIQELEALGIVLKDPLQGLVDFYWRRGGRPVASAFTKIGGARLEKVAFTWR